MGCHWTGKEARPCAVIGRLDAYNASMEDGLPRFMLIRSAPLAPKWHVVSPLGHIFTLYSRFGSSFGHGASRCNLTCSEVLLGSDWRLGADALFSSCERRLGGAESIVCLSALDTFLAGRWSWSCIALAFRALWFSVLPPSLRPEGRAPSRSTGV